MALGVKCIGIGLKCQTFIIIYTYSSLESLGFCLSLFLVKVAAGVSGQEPYIFASVGPGWVGLKACFLAELIALTGGVVVIMGHSSWHSSST